jgi:hypothetical protein
MHSFRSSFAHRGVRGGILAAGVLGLIALDAIARGDSTPALEPLAVRCADGQELRLDARENGATALIFLSTECPISNAYSPTLSELVAKHPAPVVKLVGLCVDPDVSDAALAAHAKEYRFNFPVARDVNLKVAKRFGVKFTPEVVVLDHRGQVRYQGRIDDQFAARQKRNMNPKTHELEEALAAVAAGREVPLARVDAVGCPLPKWPEAAEKVTYAPAIATILQKHCQECHRPGQIGPFSLMTYKDAAKRADDIAAIVEDRRMPPWKAARDAGVAYKHDRSLTDGEISSLSAWAEAGAPEGNPADMPPPVAFSDDWALGPPDLVLQADEDFSIPASGPDIYRCFVIPTSLPKDMYISAIEYRPGNRRVVHHILSYVDLSGEARKKDAADPGLGYSCFSGPGIEIHGDLGGWAPGNEPSRLPEGVGRALPRGGDVVMQVHYHPNGKPETDRSRIGIHFARKPVRQTLQWGLAAKFDLKLDKDQSNIEAHAKPWKTPIDMVAYAVTPHMHMLGRDMSMYVTFPDGRKQTLVKVPDWDFGWQYTYYFEQPILLPKGTELNVVAHYDNSDRNPRNPNKPPIDVKWGEATTDEMCIGFIALTKAEQDLTKPGEVDDLRKIIDKSLEEQYKPKSDEKGERRSDEKKAK